MTLLLICGVSLLRAVAATRATAAEAPKWKEEWQRVIEAAKKEGQVSLYGGQEITHPDIVAAFNKEFPFIKVLSVAGRAADLMTRIVAERRADKYLADVMASGPNGPRIRSQSGKFGIRRLAAKSAKVAKKRIHHEDHPSTTFRAGSGHEVFG